MNLKKVLTLSSVSALIVVLVFSSTIIAAPASAALNNVYYVDDDGGYDFTTIQAAIDACVSGDKIYVYAGEYRENLVIDVSITLTGEDPATTIIDGSGNTNLIYVDNVMVRISGFTIAGGRTNGIYLKDNCAGSTIVGNTITGNKLDGILMSGSDECTIKGNTIANNGYSGWGYHGIQMTSECDDNEIIGNTITGNSQNGILMSGSDMCTIKGNTIANNGLYGISMTNGCNENEIIGNTITGNYYDNILFSTSCEGNLVQGNEISYSERGWGIRLYINCNYNKIIRNTITGNYAANVYLYQQDNTVGYTIDRNLIQGNEISYSETAAGIEFHYHGDYNKIIGNTITDNFKEGITMNKASHNMISGNQVLRKGAYGISLHNLDNYNTIKNNIVLDNTTFDLYQSGNSNYNIWTRNTYGTSSIN